MQPWRTSGWLVLLAAFLASCNQGPPAGQPAKKSPRPPHLVAVEEVRPSRISTNHERTGSLRARRTVRIYSQEEGRITRLPLYEGDRVAKGDLLLSLEDDLLKAELDKAEATTRQARLDLQRVRDLEARQVASADELARAKTALEVAVAEQKLLETRLGYTRIHAPFSGVISARYWEPGDVVPRHTHVLTLSDPESLVTQLRVSELLLPYLKPGDPVDVRIDALGAGRFGGKILRLHPDVDSKTRLGVVEVVLDPVPEGARAGQFTRVTFHTAAVKRILIPFSSLQRDRAGEFVYRMDEQGRARRQPVRSGIRIADQVEILEGLDPGHQVITKGFLGLQDGKAVQPVDDVQAGDDA